MREIHALVADGLSAEMDALYRRHGPWSLIRAMVFTLARRPAKRRERWLLNDPSELDNHMLRDIGLPEVAPEIDHVLRARFEQWRHYL
jgi:uncharacterized protein YjiS (DUF1127 family)